MENTIPNANELIIQETSSKNIALKGDNFLEILKKFSPGTSIRNALDDLMRARMGALIVVRATDEVLNLVSGGFKVNSKFSPQKLVELAKMDGAIILSGDMKKILYANTLLSPSVNISSKETGTRHQAAERAAKQTGTFVIAVSERKNKITIYYGNIKYELEESSEILRRASETLQVLEKQKEVFNDLISDFNLLEINDSVTISDVCGVLQRIEIINRISEMVRRYLVELGKEGIVVSMRLRELTKNLNKEKEMILNDYFKSDYSRINSSLERIEFDTLLETTNLYKILVGEIHDRIISSKGVRILIKINLSEEQIKTLIDYFKTLDKIFSSDKDELIKALNNEILVKTLIKDLDHLREKILSGKRI
ncbi:MAG: DNA integrity scanning diadenylate cyclase DisA [Nanoarchaeota archaeon]|nr:DNA integrity scanning diadenylate cyclase DisA [Nanoarchaeota archaeon]